jgi:nucleotide-binding universal stress UspA family protein
MLNFNVIVVTTDLSDYSMRALPYAISLAERFQAQLKIVCVNEPMLQVAEVAWVGVESVSTDEQREHEIRAALDKLVREQVPHGLRAEATVLRGNAVEKIVEYARETNADLLVLCTHGRTGLSHVLMGSTAEAIVRRAPCPVLTLKQPMPVVAPPRSR